MPTLLPAAGIDREMIAKVVHSFYAAVRTDPLLAPVFNAHVADWDAHLALLVRFWSSLLLFSGEYKGAPMAAHLALPGITSAHFARWLALFSETLARHCTPDQAGAFMNRAQRIAVAFQSAMGITPIPSSSHRSPS